MGRKEWLRERKLERKIRRGENARAKEEEAARHLFYHDAPLWDTEDWSIFRQACGDFFISHIYFFLALIIFFIVISLMNIQIKNYEYEAELDTIYEEEYGTSNSWHRFKFSIDEPTWIQPVTDTYGLIATRPDGYIVRSDAPEEIIYYNAYPISSGVRQAVRLPAGDYIFIVGANCMYDYSFKGFSVGLRTLDVKTENEKENNDSLKKADRYNLESGKTGKLKTENDVDYYKIDIKENIHCYFNFSSNPVIGTFTGKRGYFSPEKKRTLSDADFFKIEVLKSDDEILSEWISYGNDEYQMNFEPGTYYIRVSAAEEYYDGEYSFAISENEFETF